MKILFSSFVYFPETIGLREHDLARGLAALGHEVYVITGLPSYPAGVVFDGYQAKANQWEVVDGVQIFRINFVGNREASGIKRIFSLLRFSLLSFIAAYPQKLNPEFVRVNQLGLPGYLISKFKRVPFFLDVQDMWPEWTATTNLSLSRLLYKVLDWQQKLIYAGAQQITTISNRFKHYLVTKGVPEEKITIIPNWAGSDSFQNLARDETFGHQEGLQGKFNLIYAGNIGSAQGVDVLLDASEILGDIPSLQMLIIGDGIEKDHLQEKCRRHNLTSVRFIERKEPHQLAHYLAWGDVLFLPLRPDPIYEVTIPSKTYSYLASGRPILAAASGDVADLIRETQAGRVVTPGDPAAVASAIEAFMAMDQAQREQLGENGRRAYHERFDRKVLIGKYDQLLKAHSH
jgi:colanic acid biosynthesis glycosyl transferase WcaI